ncbi:MAG: hypothetical protein A2W91_03210 [Bacteroidetes bacterium GWF2_38_335]|nr:MAG: hypothetical protein A2W91_03210 [Bacteroidetes bacterium GWF2_38_335]OFY77501.1 MAG: hypothetical protein A2281_01550 [Bacteroidetes bacterium RIFOXYA12_FULL_38_20]HBS87203.1 hypothetical protein [Bacteroidales bacterium]
MKKLFNIFISGVSVLFFLSAAPGDEEILYELDLENTDSYTVSCYEELNNRWVVSNDSCCLQTGVINLPGDPETDPLLDVPIDVNIFRTGNLEGGDYVRIEYRLNEFKWVVLDDLRGEAIPNSAHVFSYLVTELSPGQDIEFRIIFVTDEANEKITLLSNSANNFSIGVPFISGTDQRFRAGALPVELGSFTCSSSENGVELNWSTYSEINNDFFEVQRSINGLDFQKIGKVSGNGNSNSYIEYTFTDGETPAGTVYYRLKQTDYDGKYEYSEIIAATVSANKNNCVVKVIPNPCMGQCRVKIENCEEENGNDVSFMVFDAVGNVIETSSPLYFENGEAMFSFNNSNNLAPGIYVVRASAFNMTKESRVIVNN